MTGTYASDELTVELVAEGDELRGAIVLGDARMPLRARAGGDAVEGTFHADGADFPFSARLEGATLRLESGGEVYELARKAPPDVNPLSRRSRRAPAADEARLFRHPTGGAFRVPPGWIAQAGADSVKLVPADGVAAGELYLVSAEAAPGIEAADDPLVIEHLEQSLAELVPGATRARGPEPFGRGMRIRWSATHPSSGDPLVIVSMVSILDGVAVGVTGFAAPPLLELRLPALESVHASLAWGDGDRDPTLAGVWHRAPANGPSCAGDDDDDHAVTRLFSDGRVRQDDRAGTWSAGGGMLYLLWSDGATSSFQYRVSGAPGDRRVMLQAPGDKPLEWTERAVQD